MSVNQILLAAATHVGLVRQNNEDNFVVGANPADNEWMIPQSAAPVPLGEYGCLLVVADGMGGTNAGEVASAIAIDTIQKQFAAELLREKFPQPAAMDEMHIRKYMVQAIKTADLNILEEGKRDASRQGMGTTVVMVWIIREVAYIAWCGDSRCYVFNAASGLCRLSKDHSYVQELVDKGELDPEMAFDHPYSNIITRCLGDPEHRAIPDTRTYPIQPNDTFLLCTDGLCGLCRDEVIMQVMCNEPDNMSTCKDELIASALDAGGHDNVTVIVAKMVGTEEEGEDSGTVSDLESTQFSQTSSNWFRNLLIVLLLVLFFVALAYRL